MLDFIQQSFSKSIEASHLVMSLLLCIQKDHIFVYSLKKISKDPLESFSFIELFMEGSIIFCRSVYGKLEHGLSWCQ